MNRGVMLAVGAYIIWGVHPIYWKQLIHVPSSEIIAHRIFWSLAFFAVIISLRHGWKGLATHIKMSKSRWLLFLPAIIIGSNWATYIWAVNAGFIIETSLGYFICPLMSVFLGVLFLDEKLRRFQWLAIGIATVGVLLMTFVYGQFPWIAMYLAGTWAIYGFMRKKSPLNSVEGLTLETMFLSVPGLVYIFYLEASGAGSFFNSLPTMLLLIGAGITSGIPLLIFIAGARLIDLSLIGILQYIYPTLIFISGYFIYHEPLNESRLIGFGFIWLALVIYTAGSTLVFRRKARG